MRTRKQILVIGDSDCETSVYNFAHKLGQQIAELDYILITGGGGGVMEAVMKGANENNGLTIGITPDTDLDNANKYCNVVIPTGVGYARNYINILSADLVIAIGGRAGTLSELCYAWMFNKKIIAVSTAKGWSQKLAGLKIDDRRDDHIYPARTVEEVIKLVQELLE